MALDGNVLRIELESPLYNLLGFEHAPDTEAQRDQVAEAERKLAQPEELFVFNSEAGCRADTIATVSLFAEADGYGHDGNHDHENDLDHHDEDGKDASAHRDALVTYSLSCASPSELRRADIGLLSAFPLMEEVDMVYLGPDTQKSLELTGSQTTLDFRP